MISCLHQSCPRETPWKQALGWLDLWGQQEDRSSHPSTKGEPRQTQGSEGYQITAYYKDKVQGQIKLKWSCQVIEEEYCSTQGCNSLSKGCHNHLFCSWDSCQHAFSRKCAIIKFSAYWETIQHTRQFGCGIVYEHRLRIHDRFKWQSRTNFYRYKLGSLCIQVKWIHMKHTWCHWPVSWVF